MEVTYLQVAGNFLVRCELWNSCNIHTRRDHSRSFGLEAVFYVTGASSLIWVIFWFYLVHDTPSQHPRISKEEREYIEKAIGDGDIDRTKLVTPWRDIFTSIPVWSVVLGHSASNWGNYTLNQQVNISVG